MLTGGSLCSGSGGLDLGLEQALGVEWRWHCESDDAAAQVLERHWPGVPNYGDLFEVDWTQVERVDLVSAGFPCFVAGTLVLTRDGYREIETLAVGDEVLTHKGRWRRITTKHETPDAPVRRVRSVGVDLTCTDDHPFYARLASYDDGRELGEPEWVDAKDLRGEHFLGQTLPPVEDDGTDCHISLLRLVGRYLADGWMVDRKGRENGRVVICCSHDEEDELASIIAEGGYHATRTRERTVTKFHVTKGELYRFVQQFGRYAHGKTLPGWVYSLERGCAEALLDGYLSGDGSRDDVNHCWRASTVSLKLAYGVALLAQRARGVVASIHKYERPAGRKIEGRKVNERPSYEVHIPFGNRSCVVDGDYGWKKIKGNDRIAGTATVYNIAVEEDESYVANGAIVHNCPDYSLAGKREGLTGEHGQVWHGVAAALREIRPRLVVLENVDAIRTAPGVLRGDARDSAVGTVVADLAALGYRWAYDRLRASDVGAPHGRLRWFCVARLATDDLGIGEHPDRGVRGRGAGTPGSRRPASQAVAAGSEVDGAADAVEDGGGAASDATHERRDGDVPGGKAGEHGQPRDEDRANVPDPNSETRQGQRGFGAGEEVRESGAVERLGRRGRVDGGDRGRLLPTPTAGDAASSGSRNLEGSKAHAGVSLTDAVMFGDSSTPRRLIPTPTAEDGERGRNGAGTDRLGAATFDGDVRLLPTPQAADGDGGRQEKGAMGRGGVRPSGQKATLPLPTAVAMREEISATPFAEVGEQASLFEVAEGAVPLLPTPRVTSERNSRHAMVENQQWSSVSLAQAMEIAQGILPREFKSWDEVPGELGAAARRIIANGELLPTPTTEPTTGNGHARNLGAEAKTGQVQWGVYEGAVRRWETIFGEDAPAPTDEKGRLAPEFVRWMLGYPAGWFDIGGEVKHDGEVVGRIELPRTKKLRCLGNSVQVQCGELVGHWLAFLVDEQLI